MAHRFKLSRETIKKISEVRDALSDEASTHQDEFDERPEKWKEDEKGFAVEAWIEEIGNLVDDLENLDEKPEY